MIWRWNLRMIRGEAIQLSLIVLLVALAVASGVAAVLAAYNLSEPPEAEYGHGAVRATVIGDASAQQAAFEQVFAEVGVIVDASVPIAGSVRKLDVRVQSPDDTTAAPLLSLQAGSWPSGGEVALTNDLAESLGVVLGDRLNVADGQLAVVGLVENPTDFGDEFALVKNLDELGIDPNAVTTSFLLDASLAEINAAAVAELGTNDPGEGLPEVRTLAAIAMSIVVALAMVQVALLAGAGFAILATRRRRQYGLLAAVGATPRHIREAAAAIGIVTGSAGAILGAIAGALVVAAVVPGIEDVVGHRIRFAAPWWAIAPAMIAGVSAAAIAAWWPSRSMSTQPVTEMLRSRRPANPSTQRSSRRALILLVTGTVGLVIGMSSETVPLVVAGTLVAVVGVLMLSHWVVRIVGLASKRLGVPGRVAGRSVARHGGRSSAVMAALAVSLGVAVAVASLSAAIDDREARRPRNLPGNVAIAWIDISLDGDFVIPAHADVPTTETVAVTVAPFGGTAVIPIELGVEPGGELHRTGFLLGGASEAVMPEILLRPTEAEADDALGFGEVDATGAPITYTGHRLWIASPAMIDLWGLNDRLRDEPLVALPWSDAVLMSGRSGTGNESVAKMVTDDIPDYTSLAAGFLSPAGAAALGLDTATAGWLIVGEHDFTGEQISQIEAALSPSAVVEAQQEVFSSGPFRSVISIAATAMALVILLVAINLEREENSRDTYLLSAVGASSRTLRFVGGATAAWLAFGGVALAMALGLVAQVAIASAPNANLGFVVPWSSLGIVAVVFPLLGVVATVTRRPAVRRGALADG